MDKQAEQSIKEYALKRIREYQRKQRQEDPERFRKYAAKYRATHRDEINARQREYYRKNTEKYKAYAKKYQKEHAEELKAKKREYYIKNRDRILAKQKERNEKKKRKTAHDIMSMDDFEKNNNFIISEKERNVNEV